MAMVFCCGHGILMWLWYSATQNMTNVHSSLADCLFHEKTITTKPKPNNPQQNHILIF